MVSYATQHNQRSKLCALSKLPTKQSCAGLCKDFERKLRGLNPSMATITYDVVDLYAYVDQMADISALVYAPEPNAYIPCNKEWIKKQAYLHLRNQGGKNRR